MIFMMKLLESEVGQPLLFRGALDVSKLNEYDIVILSLDQEKAFDRVDHGYLFSVLKACGFYDNFVSWVELFYSGASCLVKVGGGPS